MRKILESKYFEIITLYVASVFNTLFTIILFSLGMTRTYRGMSIWSAMFDATDGMKYICIAFIALFIFGLFLLGISTLFLLLKKKTTGFLVYIPYQLTFILVIFFLHIYYKMLGVGAIVLLVFNAIFMTLALLLLLHNRIDSEVLENKAIERSPKQLLFYKSIVLLFEIITLVVLFTIFFIPLFTIHATSRDVSYVLIQALNTASSPAYVYIIFIVLFLAFFICLFYFASTISYFFKTTERFVRRAKISIYSNVAITLVFFLLGFFMTFYNNIKNVSASTISYVPFIISAFLLIGYSIFQGKLGLVFEDEAKVEKKKKFRLEPLLFIVALTAISYLSLFFNVIEIKINASLIKNTVALSGYQLLTTYKDLGGGYQGMAFAVFAMLFISGMLLILSIVSFLAKYKDYYRVIKFSAYANVIFMLLLGLFGFYFKIAQKINEENVKALLDRFQISLPSTYTYTISSQTIYIFFISFAVFVVMVCRGLLSLKMEMPFLEVKASEGGSSQSNSISPSLGGSAKNFDTCPAFRQLDNKQEEYAFALAQRKGNAFESITLPQLVRFVVDYARESRLHLSYSPEDIATFVAGLGASRLTILQGMSGTGKTSLPKIFSEAIFGNCEIVEVESSWRDKNELLGYYNEFSKNYTPKKFTQALYKARLNSEVPTFIVLDEMNLSRIEYYFSDFLSLMEHEENQRAIKLLNIRLSYAEDGTEKEYAGLTEGHTIQVPTNVWFIGTANRDESTFEISDKVYDRAQTMNFTKRAPKVVATGNPLQPKYVSYENLSRLFSFAKTNLRFDAEKNQTIQKVEALLVPYNISFGNRILNQMEDFVKIYCACFNDPKQAFKDAIEKILLSKVVSKLEFKIVENKEALAKEFDKLGLKNCSTFIRKLNED